MGLITSWIHRSYFHYLVLSNSQPFTRKLGRTVYNNSLVIIAWRHFIIQVWSLASRIQRVFRFTGHWIRSLAAKLPYFYNAYAQLTCSEYRVDAQSNIQYFFLTRILKRLSLYEHFFFVYKTKVIRYLILKKLFKVVIQSHFDSRLAYSALWHTTKMAYVKLTTILSLVFLLIVLLKNKNLRSWMTCFEMVCDIFSNNILVDSCWVLFLEPGEWMRMLYELLRYTVELKYPGGGMVHKILQQ